MKMLKIKFGTYEEVCLAEASSLVCLDLRKSNFYPSKIDLQIFGLCFWFSGTSGTLVLWFSGTL